MTNERYFEEYEDLEVHELMLCDQPRLDAYQSAIMKNRDVFKDKIVLDVGCGTGILSIFCAQAGAKLVLAVEASNLAKIAIETVKENNLTSIVKVINLKIENFQLPSDIDKVDIIVSEWMGFYLLHEGMLDSVIYARNNFLNPNGLMFPQYATIHVAPCSLKSRFSKWENVNGVKMTKFAEKLRLEKSKKPEILIVNSDELLHDGVTMFWLDLMNVTVAELNEIRFEEILPAQKNGLLQGFCIWFDCQFPSKDFHDAVVLSTSTKSPSTHWKQCAIVLPDNACTTVETNEPIAFKIALRRTCQDSRKYNLELEILDADNVEHPVPCSCYMTKCILAKAHIENMEINLECETNNL